MPIAPSTLPVTPTASGGPASQPDRVGASRFGLTRCGALAPISRSSPPTTLAWLPERPPTSTWTSERP